jgi:hypothetical protein
MKRMTLALPAILLGTTAFAAATVEGLDTNGDAFLTFDEMTAAYTELKLEEFEIIDTNDDNRIAASELLTDKAQEILSVYEINPLPNQLIDLNGDGFSEYPEITTVFTELSKEDFEQMDTNDDNRLSQVEIDDIDAQTILNQFRGTEEVATLGDADADGDNFLSEAEAMTAYPGLTAIEFDQIDENGDNRVDFTELYRSEAQVIVSKYES